MEEAGSKRRSSDWDIRNAPKNYVSLVAAHVITAVFSFASVWIITRYLGSAQYGSIIALVAASQLAQIFLNWSSTSLTRFGIEEFVETGYITRSFWSRTWLFLPNLALILALAGVWLHPVSDWLKLPGEIVWLVVVHIVATSVWLHVQYALQGIKMLRLQGVLIAAEKASTFLGLIVLTLASELTLETAIWSYIFPALALSIVGLVIIRNRVKLEHFVDKLQFQRMLVYSLPLVPFAVVGYLSTSQLDAFFITTYLSPSALGIYAVASQASGIAMQLPVLATTVLLSTFVSLNAEKNDEKTIRYFVHLLPTLSLIWGLVCMVGGFAGVIAIPFVFGQGFAEAGWVLSVLMGAAAMSAPSMFGYAAFSHAISATYISAIAAVACATTNVAFNFLLIPKYGLVGCALATLVSSILLSTIVVGLCIRRSNLKLSWTVFSILPPIAGLIALYLSRSPFVGLILTLGTASLIAYKFRDSITIAIRTLYLQARRE